MIEERIDIFPRNRSATGKRSDIVGAIGGGNADDARHIARCADVVRFAAGTFVAGGDHHRRSEVDSIFRVLSPGCAVRVLVVRPAEAHRDRIGAVLRCVLHAFPDIRLVGKLETDTNHHDFCVRGDAGLGAAGAVACDGAGDVRSVRVVVVRIVVAVVDVVTDQIVDIAVAVIVDAVHVVDVHDHAVRVEILTGVDPDLIVDVRVRPADTGVDDGDDGTIAGVTQFVPDTRGTEQIGTTFDGIDTRFVFQRLSERPQGQASRIVSLKKYIDFGRPVDPCDFVALCDAVYFFRRQFHGNDVADPERLQLRGATTQTQPFEFCQQIGLGLPGVLLERVDENRASGHVVGQALDPVGQFFSTQLVLEDDADRDQFVRRCFVEDAGQFAGQFRGGFSR